MRQLDEIGTCSCGCSLMIYMTKNYKRFVKCDNCGVSYALPKRGKISNSALTCPRSNFPVLIVDRPNQKAYFWADQPCFSCIHYDKCPVTAELIVEFKELEVHGY
jgi:homogentisate 1,2-dioxygenase